MISRSEDKKFMSLAINLARKNLGQTAPNPVVGAVLVKNGEIISTGITQAEGRPHAERVAVQKVANQEQIRFSTLYSTLEPCCHHGQTPPCTELIIASGISRVVVANSDPDLRVNHQGIAKLKSAGIEVVEGFMHDEAKFLNRGFFCAKTKNRAFVTLKIATSLDGKIATKSGDSRWISNETSRKFAHILRSQHEAIMVAAGTVRADNPRLDCRILGLETHSPARIILSFGGNFSFSEQVFLRNFASCAEFNRQIILFTSASNQDSPALKNWLRLNPKNQAIFFDGKSSSENYLNYVFTKISQLGINSVLVEGGSSLATQILSADLVDELIWIRSQKIIGNDGLPAIAALGVEKIEQIKNKFSSRYSYDFDDDLIEILSK